MATEADDCWDSDEDAPSLKNFVTRSLWPAVKPLLEVSCAPEGSVLVQAEAQDMAVPCRSAPARR